MTDGTNNLNSETNHLKLEPLPPVSRGLLERLPVLARTEGPTGNQASYYIRDMIAGAVAQTAKIDLGHQKEPISRINGLVVSGGQDAVGACQIDDGSALALITAVDGMSEGDKPLTAQKARETAEFMVNQAHQIANLSDPKSQLEKLFDEAKNNLFQTTDIDEKKVSIGATAVVTMLVPIKDGTLTRLHLVSANCGDAQLMIVASKLDGGLEIIRLHEPMDAIAQEITSFVPEFHRLPPDERRRIRNVFIQKDGVEYYAKRRNITLEQAKHELPRLTSVISNQHNIELKVDTQVLDLTEMFPKKIYKKIMLIACTDYLGAKIADAKITELARTHNTPPSFAAAILKYMGEKDWDDGSFVLVDLKNW